MLNNTNFIPVVVKIFMGRSNIGAIETFIHKKKFNNKKQKKRVKYLRDEASNFLIDMMLQLKNNKNTYPYNTLDTDNFIWVDYLINDMEIIDEKNGKPFENKDKLRVEVCATENSVKLNAIIKSINENIFMAYLVEQKKTIKVIINNQDFNMLKNIGIPLSKNKKITISTTNYTEKSKVLFVEFMDICFL
jgi:hypothetical protein